MLHTYHLEHRFVSLRRILGIAGVVLFMVAILNFSRNLYILAVIEAYISLSFIIIVWRFNLWVTEKNIVTVSLLFTFIMVLVILFIISFKGVSPFACFWLILIPFGCYMLNSLKVGFTLTGIFFVLTAVVMLQRFNISSMYQLDFEMTYNIMLSMLGLWLLTHSYAKSNEYSREKLFELATIDALTQINNRHSFYIIYEQIKHKNPILMLIDLDWFKSINDNYGHDAGDFVLIEVAKLLSNMTPDGSYVFRLGGEEFTILTIDKDSEQIFQLAKDVLSTIANHDFNYQGKHINITASMGIATADNPPCDLEELNRTADNNLYKAKNSGRNCVVYE